MLSRLEDLYFDAVGRTFFQKELLSKYTIKPVLRFEECLIALAPNGGMMAYVKHPDVLVLRNEPIKDHILAFAQNGKVQHNIPLSLAKPLNNIVLFDFDDDEKLYMLNNDGDYQKIDIFNKLIYPNTIGITFKEENIIKAKLYGNGFFALTNWNSFYYIPKFKSAAPDLFFSSQQVAGFNEVIIEEITDFVIIPESRSASHTIELLFCSPQIPGVVRAVGSGKGMIPGVHEKQYVLENTYIIHNTKSEPFCVYGNNREKQQGDIGVVDAIALSAKGNKVAFYKKGGIVILFDSTFDDNLIDNPRIVCKFTISTKLNQIEQEDQKKMLNLEYETQFVFCGDNTVCLVGKRLLMLLHTQGGGNTLVYKMYKKQSPKSHYLYAKAEIDGIRVLTPEECYFISEVNSNLQSICSPFSEEPGKRLLDTYTANLDNIPTCHSNLYSMGDDDLITAIDQLLEAATQVWDSELQVYLLKAAKHGKLFTNNDTYNHEKFAEICRTLRIVNSLRKNDNPRLLTFEEYRTIKGKIIKLLIRNHSFAMAEELAKFFEEPNTEIYYKFILNHVKQLDALSTEADEKALFDEIDRIFDRATDIPFLKLAKKCFALGKNVLGNKILDKEKSALVKLPELLEQGLWKEGLSLAMETLDSNVIFPVIDKISKSKDVNTFVNMAQQFEMLNPYIKEFFVRNDVDSLIVYEEASNQYEDMFYSLLEMYFNSDSLAERKAKLKLMTKCLSDMKKNKYDSKELEFLKKYVNELSSELNCKEEIYKVEHRDFNVNCSQYEMLIRANDVDKLIGKMMYPKALSGIMKLNKEYDKGFGKVIEMLKNEKKMKDYNLMMINVVEVMYENKQGHRVCEAARKVIEPMFFIYKFAMMKDLK
jgi:hypothetical protein